MSTLHRRLPYADQGHDHVRAGLELRFFDRLLAELLPRAGGEVLDLGCGDGLAARLAGPRLSRYVGLDMRRPEPDIEGDFVEHDLRHGLGPVGGRPFDLYLATFGVASHIGPEELSRLLAQIAGHACPGALVALEALGLFSLEWPGLWATEAGHRRILPYRLGGDVTVHPWAPRELAGLFEVAGIEPVRAIDRTVQAGPKTGCGRYWPGLPQLRRAANDLLGDSAGEDAARATLGRHLPPLPAGPAAALHHSLAERRREIVSCHTGGATALAGALWDLEPRSGGGFGHGLTLVGRVT